MQTIQTQNISDKRKPKQVRQKKKKAWFLRLNAWLHLWPSIVSGLIVVFVCLTGTIIVYCDEILDFTAGNAKYVEPEGSPLSTAEIIASIHKTDPHIDLSQIVFFKDPKRSIRIRAFHDISHKLNFTYVNPYTAEVLKVDYTGHFFFTMAHLHANLLAGPIGSWTVLLSTIIFFISCITGLILWWPARWTKKTRNDSFTIKWKARFKRLNYDLHNVYGFYALLICFILSFTGILIFFHASLGNLVITSFGGADKHSFETLPQYQKDKPSLDMAPFVYQIFKEHTQTESISIWTYNLGKTGAYLFQLGASGLKSFENYEIIAVDRYSGERLTIEPKNLKHDKIDNFIWQLHMGQWWGQFGKFSTFLAGIIATSLPITGFLIWWGRRKKKKKVILKS